MKKIVLIMLILNVMLCGAACRNEQNRDAENKENISTEESISIESDVSNEITNRSDNILIAYFTWADNTVVDNEDEAIQSVLKHYESIGDSDKYNDADAVSSSSVVAPGNVEKMARWIQQYVGGDLFSITVTEPYPCDYDECMNRAADEKAENARPELLEHLSNMEDYDVIFLGFPNWWYTAPMPVFSFIDEYDLSNKIIIPFCSHGTGGLAGSVQDIIAALPDTAEVLEPIGVYRADINQAQSEINQWLETIGFHESEKMAEGKITEMTDNEKKIMMTGGEQEVDITLYDTPAANALYDRLPLELEFEDFNGMEKISYLSESLPTEDEPDGCEPEEGDFCLYAPWGNLSIFYKSFRYSNGLILLGHVDSGMEIITDMPENSLVTIEVVNK